MAEINEQYKLPPNSVSQNLIKSHDILTKKQDKIDNGSSISLNYRFEAARLKSFQNWPHLWPKSEQLAAAGFYYTGNSDIVRCFECDKELWQWKAEDDPMVDHERWSRSCWFVRNIPCGNVPIGTDPSTIPAFMPKGVDVCGPYDTINMPEFHEDQEIEERRNCKLTELKSRPKYPEYTNYSARLASYDTWPKAMSQTKEELATAGLYYSGSGDETVCYYCGGGLRDWEPYDDPWVEHAKWFKKCPYLLVTKGMEFINNISEKTYTKIETVPSAANKLDKKLEKDDSKSIASRSSQHSISSEETNNPNACTKSNEASNEEKSIQIQDDKSYDKEATLCKICFSRELQIVFIPCGHLLACTECAKNMKICGVCRKDIEIAVQVYFT